MKFVFIDTNGWVALRYCDDGLHERAKQKNKVKKIFQLIKKDYTKKEKQAHNICHKIDYNLLCCNEELHKKISSLKYLLNCIDKCLEGL